MARLIQLRRDYAENWEEDNPTLLSGEVGLEKDTGKIKIGNGSDSWNDIDYVLTQDEADDIISTIIGFAPSSMNTLGELADAVNDDADYGDVLDAAVDARMAADTIETSLSLSPIGGSALYELNEDGIWEGLLNSGAGVWAADNYDPTKPNFLEDSSGNSNHMRLGSQWPTYVAKGALNLPGITGNYVSTPDSVANSITGDIDIVVRAALADWTSSDSYLVAKIDGASFATFSYGFLVYANGRLGLELSNGSSWDLAESSVAPTVSDGAALWVRVTWRQSDGRTQFFTCADQSTMPTNGQWVQLGTDYVLNTIASIANSTTPVTIGCKLNSGSSAGLTTGRIMYAEIRNGIAGTVVNKFDLASVDDFSVSWASSTGETWKVQRPGAVIRDGLILPGVTGSYARVADSPTLRITGDSEYEWHGVIDDLTPSTVRSLWSKDSNSQRMMDVRIDATGQVRITNSPDGTTTLSNAPVPTLGSVGYVDGDFIQLKVDRRSSDGRVRVWHRPNSLSSWAQLGADVTLAVGALYAATVPVEIGSRNTGSSNAMAGRCDRFIARDGIGGTTVLDIDFTDQDPYAQNFVCTTGQTVTLNGQTGSDSNDPKYLEPHSFHGNQIYFPGVVGNYLSIPDSAALDITGDIDIRILIAMDDWTPSSESGLIAKYQSTGQLSWRFNLGTGGLLMYRWSADGTNTTQVQSTTAVPVSDGGLIWVRVTHDVNNGSGGNDVKFWTSPYTDGGTWTQLGSTVTTASTTSIFSSSSIIEIGSNFGGISSASAMQFWMATIHNGIDGTVVLDIRSAHAIPAFVAQTSFPIAIPSATVTINRSTTGRKITLVDKPVFLFGTDDYMECPDPLDGSLDIGATDSLSVTTAFRTWSAAGSNYCLIAKKSEWNTIYPGWLLNAEGTPSNMQTYIADGTTSAGVPGTLPITQGALNVWSLTISRSNAAAVLHKDNTAGANQSMSGVGSLANTMPLRIGRRSGGTNYADMEWIGAGFYRRALTDNEIARLNLELV